MLYEEESKGLDGPRKYLQDGPSTPLLIGNSEYLNILIEFLLLKPPLKYSLKLLLILCQAL